MSHDLNLGLERLEQRQMMAGDVAVTVTNGGDLIITGDQADNQLVVTSTEPNNQFHVKGLNGTTINGQESVVVNNVVDDIRINLRGGDNAILLSAHNEYNYANGFEVDDIRFNSGGGNDIIALQQVEMRGDFRVATGGGDDLVMIDESELDQARIRTSGGNDAVLTNASMFQGIVDWNLGSGDDTVVSVDNVYTDDARFRGAGGQDLFATSADRFESDWLVNGGGSSDRLLKESGARLSVVVGAEQPVSLETTEQLAGLDLLVEVAQQLDHHQAANDYFTLFSDYLD